MMQCDICNGDGRYPIIDRYGRTRYTIQCPDCLGSGDADEEAEDRAVQAAKQAAAQLDAKYEAAMKAKP